MSVLLVLLATLTLTLGDNGHAFTVAPRTKVVVVLPSNASTGYRWRLAARPERHVLRLVSHRYVAPATKRVGAAGKEIWRFDAVGAGDARLRLAYVGPSRPARAARRFGASLHVR